MCVCERERESYERAHGVAACRLEELALSNNELATLPPVMGTMAPTLRLVTREGNPLRTLWRTVLERGAGRLLEYLQFCIAK